MGRTLGDPSATSVHNPAQAYRRKLTFEQLALDVSGAVRLLDIGCGRGIPPATRSTSVPTSIRLDGSASAVAIAGRKVLGACSVQQDLTRESPVADAHRARGHPRRLFRGARAPRRPGDGAPGCPPVHGARLPLRRHRPGGSHVGVRQAHWTPAPFQLPVAGRTLRDGGFEILDLLRRRGSRFSGFLSAHRRCARSPARSRRDPSPRRCAAGDRACRDERVLLAVQVQPRPRALGFCSDRAWPGGTFEGPRVRDLQPRAPGYVQGRSASRERSTWLDPGAMRSFVVGGAGFIGSHWSIGSSSAGRSPSSTTSASASARSSPAPRRAGRARRGRRARARRATRRDARSRLVVPPRRQPRGALGPRAHAARSRAGHHRHLQRARGGAPAPACRGSSSPRPAPSTATSPSRCAEGDLGNLPISLYGASKFAGEALIAAFVECFGLAGYICRFGNVVGPRGTHGAALDFCKKLQGRTPSTSRCSATARQAKPYLHVTDCAAGMLFVLDHAQGRSSTLQPRARPTPRACGASPSCASPRRPTRTRASGTPAATAAGRATCRARAWTRTSSPRSASACASRRDEAVELAVAEVAREVFREPMT